MAVVPYAEPDTGRRTPGWIEHPCVPVRDPLTGQRSQTLSNDAPPAASLTSGLAAAVCRSWCSWPIRSWRSSGSTSPCVRQVLDRGQGPAGHTTGLSPSARSVVTTRTLRAIRNMNAYGQTCRRDDEEPTAATR